MRRIRFARSAVSDLDEIWEHAAERWGIEQAQQTVAQITDRIAFLAVHPRAGAKCRELGAGIRSFVFYPFVVYYREERSGLRILVIRHGSRRVSETE